ncbi:hypothetical protein VTI74DRAFT_9967 [Chaetomium olivicolor]
MSTFNGLVAEFPDIRVDFFRPHPELRPPLACFLSHIHSDHLAGLENLRSPFVYCSAATRQMLLRLERYPCRINYARGILEARIQKYRHLKNLLKPIPLETPTLLELEPGNHLQVTLFDANHCPGAVMFLFEGQGKAILYTGDIRSEPWFVNAIARSPFLIEYTSGFKALDTIYLDTSFIDNIRFPTKSEGISELLQKVSRYPANTIFHFQAWTYGYEDVWLALSKALGSKIHVDEYKMSMFCSVVATNPDSKFAPSFHLAPEAPGLVGFMCGNTYHVGCLTSDETVRIHSCEKGNYCATVKSSPVVWIRPIITRLADGQDVAEVGVGGGGDDLEREAELDYLSPEDVQTILDALSEFERLPDEMRDQIGQLLLSAIANGRKIPLDIERAAFGENNQADLIRGLQAITSKLRLPDLQPQKNSPDRGLPKVITFPYSRHSSYPELCDFVGALKPRDVWPCTVDASRWLRDGITVEQLFSEYCSGDSFRHDQLLKKRFGDYDSNVISDPSSQLTLSFTSDDRRSQPSMNESAPAHHSQPVALAAGGSQADASLAPPLAPRVVGSETDEARSPESEEHESTNGGKSPLFDPTSLQDSQSSTISELALEIRFGAFKASLMNAQGKARLDISLLSTTGHHTMVDRELSYPGLAPDNARKRHREHDGTADDDGGRRRLR